MAHNRITEELARPAGKGSCSFRAEVQDMGEAPLSLGAFIQYFSDNVTLHGPSDELRAEAQREILLVPSHERITYSPYCVENRKTKTTTALWINSNDHRSGLSTPSTPA